MMTIIIIIFSVILHVTASYLSEQIKFQNETLFYCAMPRQPKRGLCALRRSTNDGFDFIADCAVYFMVVNLLQPNIVSSRQQPHVGCGLESITWYFQFLHARMDFDWRKAKMSVENPIVRSIYLFMWMCDGTSVLYSAGGLEIGKPWNRASSQPLKQHYYQPIIIIRFSKFHFFSSSSE